MESNEKEFLKKDSNSNKETEQNGNLIKQNDCIQRNMNYLNIVESFLEMTKNIPKYSDRIKIKELIKIFIEFPKEDEFNIAYRFPNIACKSLLNADKRIQDMIFLSEEDFNNKYENTDKKNINIETSKIKEKRKFNIDKHNDILDILFVFTKDEKALANDVLCGYFHKVISLLM